MADLGRPALGKGGRKTVNVWVKGKGLLHADRGNRVRETRTTRGSIYSSGNIDAHFILTTSGGLQKEMGQE